MNYELRTLQGLARMGDFCIKRRKLNITLLSFVVLFLISSVNTYAIDYTLNGTWSNPADWSGGVLPPNPLPAGDAVYFNGANNIVDVNVTTAAGSFTKIIFGKSLTINAGVTLTLNGGFLCQSPIPAKFDILGTLVINNSGTDAFQVNNASQVNVLAGGIINHTGTGTCRVQGEVNNSGTLEVASGATFLYQIINATYNFENSGVVKGEGIITLTNAGTFINHAAGTVAPGSSPGCLTVSNGFNLGTGTLAIEVDGKTTACTDYDQLKSSGSVTLGGALDINVNYSASTGDVITFIDAGFISGTFASNNVPAGWTLKYNFPNSGEVSIENTGPANALDFDGSNDFVTISNPRDFDIGSTSDLIFTASIKTSSAADQYLFANVDLSGAIRGYQIGLTNGGKLTLDWESSAAGISIQGTSSINDGNCHDVRVEVDRSSFTAKLIVDGVEENSVTHTKYAADATPLNASRPVYVGSDRIGNMKWNGEIEDMIVSIGGTVQGAWTFNQGVAGGNNTGVTTLTDNSGQGNDGTLINFALTGTSSNWVTSTCNTALSNANALRFDGADDHVSVSNPRDFDIGSTSDLIFTASIKTSSAADQYLFANVDLSGAIRGYQIGLTNGGKLTLDWESSAAGISIQGTSSINDGNCHDVRVEVDRSSFTAKLIVDGVEENSVTHTKYAADATPLNASRPVYVGSDRIGNMKWNGEIEDMIVSIGGTVQGSWNFNQGVGGDNNASITTLTDNSGQGNNGTLTNFALTGYASNWVTSSCVANPCAGDVTNPTAVAQDVTITLDANGNATLTAAQVNNGSSDDCDPNPTIAIDQTAFDCSHVGVTQPSNYALNFNGTDDYATVTIAGQGVINRMPVTVEAWVKPEDRTDAANWVIDGINTGWYPNNVISNDNPGKYGHGFGANIDATSGINVITIMREDGFHYIHNALTVDQWQHIAVVYETTGNSTAGGTPGTVKTYVNGILVDTETYNVGTFNGIASMYIGRHQDGTFYNTRNYFKGDIDEVRMWNKALTGAEITANYQNTALATTSDLIGYYTFEDATGTTISDVNGSNDATMTFTNPNAAWVSPGAPVNVSSIGNNTVTLTVTDGNGNQHTATANITVEDNIAPTVVTKNHTATLNGGTATITIADINNGTSDNCAVDFLGLDVTTFNAPGTYTVTLTAKDKSGNTSTGTATVTVINPTFDVDFNASAICSDATEWLVPIDVGAVPSDIGAISLVLDYDKTKLAYASVHSAHSNLTNAALDNSGSLTVNEDVNGGKIYISWANTTAATISNATVLTLKFVPANSAVDFSAIAGQTTNFSWDQTPSSNCEFADNMGTVMGTVFNAQLNATVNATPTVVFTNDATSNAICVGESITFTATGGTSYSFQVNGGTAVAGTGANNNEFTTSSLAVGSQTVSVTVTDANGCSKTEQVTITVNPLPTAGLTSDAINNTTLCAGENITFTGTGGTFYSFDVNGGTPVAGTGTGNAQFSSSTLANGDVVTVTVTDANGCSSTANLTMVVNPLPTVGISSDDADNTICAGDAVTFTGSGATSYSFDVNGGTPVAGTGTNGDEFSSSTLANGDVVTVTGTDANGCSNTASITMTVNPSPTAGLSSDKANDEICAGETITFTGTGAGAVGGGSGNALHFVHSDEVAGTNANLPVGNTARTIEAWIKTDPSSGGDESIFEWGSTFVGNARSGLFIRSSGRLVHIAGNNDLDGTTNLRDGQWHHVAVTHDGTTTTLYLDGNVEATATKNYTTSGSNFTMGGNANNEFFDGTIDEVRVWNSAKTQSQIQSTMNTSLSGSESGLVAYFNFNQGVAGGTNTGITTLTDATGNGNGTLSGFALTGATSNFVAGASSVVGVGGTYEFFVNSASQGVASTTATFSSSTLANGDKVKVKVTNANGCVAESAEIIVTVNPVPTTTLTSDDADSRVCQGQSVTFTAASTDGADEFIFMSSIDGVVQAQSATATYTDNGLQDGEVISVIGVNSTSGCQQASTTTFTFDVDGCHTVSGNLVYKNSPETAMGNVVITVTGPGLAANTTVTTDVTDGSFSVANLFDNETYTFSYATTKTHGGINSTDALLALIDAVTPNFLSGLNEDASDVNADNVTTGADALQIQRRFVTLQSNFNDGGSPATATPDWTFEAGTFTPTADITGQKLYALAMGDINGSYVPNSAENKLPTVNIVNDGQLTANDGDRVLIPVRIKQTEDVGAMSLAMFFPSNAMTIHDVTLADGTSMMNHVNGDELRVAWANNNSQIFATDDVLYYVDVTIHDVAAYNTAPFSLTAESELADGAGSVLTQVILGVPTIQAMVTSTNAIEAAAASVRSFPNPFSDRMTIEYDLPSTSNVTIQMFNSLGQEVATLVNDKQGEGTHRAIWNADNQASGVYFYTITVTDGDVSYKQTKQVILMK